MPKKMAGMFSFVVGLRPIFTPLAVAVAIPLLTRLRIICNSSSEKTPAIFMNASLIGSVCPLWQSIVMLPTIIKRSFFSRMISMISQGCCVERDRDLLPT